MSDDYYDNMVEDEDGISYPGGMRGMFESKELNLCGCGSDNIKDDIINIIKEFLKDTEYNHSYITDICKELELDEKYVEMILFYLDDKGLLEHGGSIRGSWLSDKGKKLVLGKYKEIFE